MRQIFLLLFMAAFATAEQFPQIAAESLAGQQVKLPDASKGHFAVVIIGFSKSSQTSVKETEARLRKELGSKGADVYQVAVLEDAPRFVRGFITKAMKGSTPAEQQSHFLVVVSGKKSLQSATQYSNENDAYVVLLDGKGEIVWRAHGSALSDSQVKEFSERTAKN